jgi:glycosyltransferase involved in cell wall biosynthesis
MVASSPKVLVNGSVLGDAAGGGARVFVENLLRELPRAWPDAEIRAVVPASAHVPDVTGVVTTRIRSFGPAAARVLVDLGHLPQLSERYQADVLISPHEVIPTRLRTAVVVIAQNLMYHCSNVAPLPTGPAAARLRSRLQFAFYRRQMPRAYRRAEIVVAVSAHTADVLARRADLDLARTRVVPCGSDRLPRYPRDERRGRRQLLIVGSVAHYKRLDVAVRALAELRAAAEDYELVLAGDLWPGYGAVVSSVAGETGVRDLVRFLGAVPDAELARLFATCHAVVSLSSCESFGLPVVEAMRAGAPVVVADEPWSAETSGDAAIRVQCEPGAIAAAIASLSDAEERERRSAAGVAEASRFTWLQTASGIAAAAQEAIKGRP